MRRSQPDDKELRRSSNQHLSGTCHIINEAFCEEAMDALEYFNDEQPEFRQQLVAANSIEDWRGSINSALHHPAHAAIHLAKANIQPVTETVNRTLAGSTTVNPKSTPMSVRRRLE